MRASLAVALDRYFDLQRTHPQLFRQRSCRQLILDRRQLEQYAADHGVDLGVVASTPHLTVVVDLVQSDRPEGTLVYPYVRTLYASELNGGTNVVVVATVANPALGSPGDILLVEQERHASGGMHWEMPRGSGEPGLSGEQNALKELREEAGYSGNVLRRLANVYIDTGLTGATASFYQVGITDRVAPQAEAREEIRDRRFVSPADLWEMIRGGEMRDSFTIQGLALLEELVRK